MPPRIVFNSLSVPLLHPCHPFYAHRRCNIKMQQQAVSEVALQVLQSEHSESQSQEHEAAFMAGNRP